MARARHKKQRYERVRFDSGLPIFFNSAFLLEMWLKDVPEASDIFVKLFLVLSLSECLSNPLMTSALATGKIRNYQIIVGGLIMLNLPVSYLFLKAGAPAEVTVVVAIVISQICLWARLAVLRKLMSFPAGRFLRKVYLNILAVTASSILVILPLQPYMPEGVTGFVVNMLLCLSATSVAILLVGLDSKERNDIVSYVHKRFRR